MWYRALKDVLMREMYIIDDEVKTSAWISKNKYSKDNNGKAKWLQNILFSILDRLGAHHIERKTETIHRRIEIDTYN